MSESPRYWWFNGVTVKELTARLNKASETAIFKVNLDGQEMTLEVVEPGATFNEEAVVETPLNESHPCPPQCLE